MIPSKFLVKVLSLFILFSVTNLTAKDFKPVTSVRTNEKVVAITLDDGPVPSLTERFLNLFKKESVKATFFNIGEKIEAHPELVKEVLAQGHEIGNHSFSHPRLTDLKNSSDVFDQINKVQLLVKQIAGYTPKLFRAPFLKYDNRTLNVLKRLNLKLVSASVFDKDAKKNVDPQGIIERVLGSVKPGSIILGHEREHTLVAMRTIIPALKKQGYGFVTVSELLSLQSKKFIPPNDERIHFTGAKFSKVSSNEIIFQRHSDAVLAIPMTESLFNPVKARTTTGVTLSFKTASPEVKLYFRKLPGEQRQGLFDIYQNGVKTDEFKINGSTDSSFAIPVKKTGAAGAVMYRVLFPPWNNLAFKGLEIDSAYDLISYEPPKKKIYVAYGNSITHGVGQLCTDQTYAFLLAEKFGWELYNVAVGGAKASLAIADMLRDNFNRIDFMTILIGYNDYNFQAIDTVEYKRRMNGVLNSVRQTHPNTEIFCITQTYTKQLHSKTSGLPIEDFRTALANLVRKRQEEGDGHLYLIRGEEITDSNSLKDKVHFNVEGAARFADSLAEKISALTGLTSVNETTTGRAIRKNNSSGILRVFPNPTGGELNFGYNGKIRKVKIFNMLGQKVGDFSNEIKKIHLRNLSKGVYFVNLTSASGEVKFGKFILK